MLLRIRSVATAIPDGASGFVATGSAWVKASAAQALSGGFVDSGFSLLANQIWAVRGWFMRRIFCKTTLATNKNIRL